jgi:hypothetical protein
MGFVATYDLRCDHLPLVDVAAAVPEATLAVSLVASADGPIPLVVHLEAGPAAAVERELDAASFVDSYSVLDDGEDARRYKLVPAVGMNDYWAGVLDVSELRSLAATHSEIDLNRVRPWGWLQRGWFADRKTLAQFREFWADNGGFELRRLVPDAATSEGGLTDAQREALVAANDLGYFEIPRRASLADVADELGVAQSSLSERLRRAHSHLVETTVRVGERVDAERPST